MSNGPEFEEIKIEAADIRRKNMVGALLLGAVLPGMAEILPEAERRTIATSGAVSGPVEVLAGAADDFSFAGQPFFARDGFVVAMAYGLAVDV